ncbi:hypothetical protein [Calothrix sp. NIES-2100]|uniref:hypothetical protein n=1 Tax=Calothrix sp. NIES-2100 TaxID=1954172 RepID=UPI0030D93B04
MDELNILITAIGAIFLFLALLSDYFRRRIIWNAYSIRLLAKNIISAILLENKRSNARSIYSSKFGFDFNFFYVDGTSGNYSCAGTVYFVITSRAASN